MVRCVATRCAGAVYRRDDAVIQQSRDLGSAERPLSSRNRGSGALRKRGGRRSAIMDEQTSIFSGYQKYYKENFTQLPCIPLPKFFNSFGNFRRRAIQLLRDLGSLLVRQQVVLFAKIAVNHVPDRNVCRSIRNGIASEQWRRCHPHVHLQVLEKVHVFL